MRLSPSTFVFAIHLCAIPMSCLAGSMSIPGQFAVSEAGAATYSIPIDVPPGIGGIEPKLALAFHSQAGNGLLGMGWNLQGLSSITRCPRTMAQDGVRGGVNFDLNDRYCLDGQRLIRVGGTEGGNGAEYRTEQDSFSAVVSYTDPSNGGGPAKFLVRTKAGLTMEYGYTADSRIEAKSKTVVSTWALNRVVDQKNNEMRIYYSEENASGQWYPSSISYSMDGGSQNPESQIQFGYESRPDIFRGSDFDIQKRLVRISISNGRPLVELKNYQLSYSTGPITARSRLSGLTLCETQSGSCVDPYVFSWLDGGFMLHDAPRGQGVVHAYWDGVVDSARYKGKVFTGDFNGDGKTDLMMIYRDPNSPVVSIYHWHADAEGKLVYVGTGSSSTHAHWDSVIDSSIYKGKAFTGDFNGDGKTDLMMIYRDPSSPVVSIYHWHADAEGKLVYVGTGSSSTHAQWDGVIDSSKYRGKAFTGDFNGDGKTDLMMIYRDPNSPVVSIYHWHADAQGKLAYVGTGSSSTHAYWDGVVDSSRYKGRAFTGDFNGDGKTDLMMIYRDPNSPVVSIYHWHANAEGKLVYVGSGSSSTHAHWDSVIDSSTYKGKAFVGDFNGDGKTDLMMVYRDPSSPVVSIYHWNADAQGRLAYVGTGSGSTNAHWDGVVDSSIYKGKAFTGDFNGDGKTDLMMIYRDPNSPVVSIYHWNADAEGKLAYVGTGNSSTHAHWDGVVDSSTYKGEAFTGDFNGDGKADLMMVYRDPSSPEVSIYHWNSPAPAADVLTDISTPTGGLISINYLLLTDEAIFQKSTGAAYPEIDLQFPMPVVSSVTSSNGIGGAGTVSYKYGGLKAELGTGRGMLGFNRMEATQIDTELVTTTSYRQDWPFTGLVSKVERGTSAANRSNLGVTTYTYDCTDFDSTPGCQNAPGKRYFPFVTRVEEKSWDLNGVALPITRTDTVYDCGNDSTVCFGNALDLTVSTLNPDGSPSGYSKRTQSQFYNDTNNWILGRLLRSSVIHTSP